MTYGIYKFENKINHKVYIGLSTNLEERYHKHYLNMNNICHDEVFYKALRKYGWSNFEYTILEQYEYQTEDQSDCDLELLGELEDQYILQYNSLVPNGYNMIPGGTNGSGIMKRKPVEQYDLEGNFIKEYISAFHASLETGFCHSDICACCRENNNKKIVHGYQWKYKNSNKIIQKVIDKNSVKTVYQFTKDGTLINQYNNLEEAAKATNLSKTTICGCCTTPDRNKSAGGYMWSYNSDPSLLPKYKPKEKQAQKKSVAQYTLNNELIITFNSITEASKATGILPGNISNVCSGKRKTAGGFIWKYIDN